MKRLLILLIPLLVLLSSCKKDQNLPPLENRDLSNRDFRDIKKLDTDKPTPRHEIDATLFQLLAKKELFAWSMLDDKSLWSTILYSDSVVALGYKPRAEGDLSEKMHLIDIQSQTWRTAKENIIKFIIDEERKAHPDLDISRTDILLDEHEGLPVIFVKLGTYQTIAKLRRLDELRYVEPMAYNFDEPTPLKSGSCSPANNSNNYNGGSDPGCNNNAASYSHFTNVSPFNSKIPWHYKHSSLNIDDAWTHCDKGNNIAIGMIDTGTSSRQAKLSSQFNTGMSTGRSITKYGTFRPWWPWPWASTDGVNDDCGHGTLMAGCMAGPRSGNSTIGVAYKADLYAVRGTNDVLLGSLAEKKGVMDALYYLGNRSNVKIISMSIGHPLANSAVSDGIIYAYLRGKLIFAAAGTSGWFGNLISHVIHPANMPQTIAVTGVKSNWPGTKRRCTKCHNGFEVDFVVPMQDMHSSNCHVTHSLMMAGNTPAQVGGSSIATATMAGVAALVWGQQPSKSRSWVLSKLKNAADVYPSRHWRYGWGVVDANAAVLAAAPPPPALNITISGPDYIRNSGTYTWTASTSNGVGSINYNWAEIYLGPGNTPVGNCTSNGNSYTCNINIDNNFTDGILNIYVSASSSSGQNGQESYGVELEGDP